MSVFKRPDTGKYKFEFTVDGKKHSRSGFTSKRAAETAEKEYREGLTGWKPGMLFKDAVDRYWRIKGAHHSNSENERTYVEVLRYHLGDIQADQIDNDDVSKLIEMRAQDNVAPSTLNRSITQLVQRILNFNKIYNKDLSELLFPEDNRVRELTYEEEDRLLEHLRPDFHRRPSA